MERGSSKGMKGCDRLRLGVPEVEEGVGVTVVPRAKIGFFFSVDRLVEVVQAALGNAATLVLPRRK